MDDLICIHYQSKICIRLKCNCNSACIYVIWKMCTQLLLHLSFNGDFISIQFVNLNDWHRPFLFKMAARSFSSRNGCRGQFWMTTNITFHQFFSHFRSISNFIGFQNGHLWPSCKSEIFQNCSCM